MPLPGVPALSACPQSATMATAETTTATSARHARESPASRGLPRHPMCPSECAGGCGGNRDGDGDEDGNGDSDGDFLLAGSRLPPTLRHTWRRTTAATPITTAMAPGATPWTPAPPLTIVPSSPVVSPYPHPCRARGDPGHTQGGFGPLRVAGSCASATLCFLSAAGSTVPSIMENAGGGLWVLRGHPGAGAGGAAPADAHPAHRCGGI